MQPHLLDVRLGGAWRVHPLGASPFCDTWRAASAGGDVLFVKSAPVQRAEVLEAEADGLAALGAVRDADPQALRVPRVVACWRAAGIAVLAMEWLAFGARTRPGVGERLGRALAALHRAPPPEGTGRFGWRRDNWLGATPQRNTWSASTGREGWIQFMAHQRLEPLARGLPAPLPELARRLAAEALPRLLDADGHVPRPALVHGDLWSGNWSALDDGLPGTPVAFDPAVSVSDPESDLAMLELFGAPPPGFWPAYQELLPVAPGYARRRDAYQLVHLLNHARLFGGGYVGQAVACARAAIAAAG